MGSRKTNAYNVPVVQQELGGRRDVSQCDTFTQKQFVLHTGPPPEAKAADKAAAPGKGKPEKGKPIKGKQGNRTPHRT